MNVCLFVTEFLLNGWTDFNEIVCVCSSGVLNGFTIGSGELLKQGFLDLLVY